MTDSHDIVETDGELSTPSSALSSRSSNTSICLVNLGPKETSKRRTVGIVSAAIGVVGLIVLAELDMGRTWRLALFVPFWLGALGWYQAAAKT